MGSSKSRWRCRFRSSASDNCSRPCHMSPASAPPMKLHHQESFQGMPISTRLIFVLATTTFLAACTREGAPARTIAADPAFCSQVHTTGVKLSEHLAPLAPLMRTSTGVYSLEEGDVSLVSRAWLAEAGERTIDVQYFIFTADNVGVIAVDYLLRAADRGVQVRILVDDFMLEVGGAELLALDAHPNIEIRLYNPTANIGKNLPTKLFNLTTDFRGFNQRMHNKTFIVDGKVAITGGRNIAAEYFDYDHEFNFRDRDVLLLGGTSADVQRSFDQFWNNALSVPIRSLVRTTVTPDTATAYRSLHEYACDPRNFWPQVRERIKSVPVAFTRILESGAMVWSDSVTFVSDGPGQTAGQSAHTRWRAPRQQRWNERNRWRRREHRGADPAHQGRAEVGDDRISVPRDDAIEPGAFPRGHRARRARADSRQQPCVDRQPRGVQRLSARARCAADDWRRDLRVQT